MLNMLIKVQQFWEICPFKHEISRVFVCRYILYYTYITEYTQIKFHFCRSFELDMYSILASI